MIRLAAALLLVGVSSVPAPAQQATRISPDVLHHTVTPDSVEPGQRTWQRLVVAAEEGILLRVSDEEPPNLVVERLGAWRVRRDPGSPGTVVWTFRAPLAAWAAGDWSLPDLRLDATHPGAGSSRLTVAGPSFHARSPLPAGARTLRVAGPELPRPRGSTWTDLLAVLPLLVLAGSGAVWWHAGRTATTEGDEAVLTKVPPSLADVAELSHRDPRAAAFLLAQAVRGHRNVLGCGVRSHHSTGEALVLLAASEPLRSAVDGALRLADAVKFGGARVAEEQVLNAAAVAAEALGDG